MKTQSTKENKAMSKKNQDGKTTKNKENKMQDNIPQDEFAPPKTWSVYGPIGLTTAGDCPFPAEWTLFGSVGKDDQEPDFAAMTAVPGELTIAGNRLVAQPAAFTSTGGKMNDVNRVWKPLSRDEIVRAVEWRNTQP